VLVSQAESLTAAGQLADAEALYRAAIAQSGPSALARTEFATFLFRFERYAEAAGELRRVLETTPGSCDPQLRVIALHNLAAVHRAMGDARTAAELQQRSLSEELGAADKSRGELCASTLSNLASDALLAGRINLARKLLRRSLTLETARGSLAGQAADWGSLGLVALFEGRHKAAVACLLRAYLRHRQLRDAFGMGCDLLNLAEAARRLGRAGSSTRFLERALAQFESAHAARQTKKVRLLLEQARRVSQVAERDPLLN
jgi:tetratricopeptide (TPR) repeat protein